MRITTLLSALLLGLLLGSQSVTAQETTEESQQLYDIELVVFSRQAPGADSGESWPDDPGTPDWSNAVNLDGQGDIAAIPGATLLELLPRESHRLSADARRLKRSGDRLQPLVHLAWRQPGFPREMALPVYLRSSARDIYDQPLLEGTVTISLGRYLHADLDLLLRQQSPYSSAGDSLLEQKMAGHRFQAHRKMRSGELHYLDHPLLGALILIEKYEEPEPEIVEEVVAEEQPVVETTQETQAPATSSDTATNQ
ncbi:MAG: CsiV family protein [Sedimenticola sp.]